MIITLTTDFGLQDAYVAAMKGVILTIAPGVTVIDGTHEITPQDITAGAFQLSTLWPYYPPSTIHVAVVDPGVGTTRKPIAVRAPHGIFVGPDNGILAPTLIAQGVLDDETGTLAGATAVVLENPAYRLPVVSNTFHGRDVFAPAAAHLANGVPLTDLGRTLSTLNPGTSRAVGAAAGELVGTIQHVDRFGNLITDLRAAQVPNDSVIRVGDDVIDGLSTSYQDDDVIALIGSSGYLEIAVRNGSAEKMLGVARGSSVRVQAGD